MASLMCTAHPIQSKSVSKVSLLVLAQPSVQSLSMLLLLGSRAGIGNCYSVAL